MCYLSKNFEYVADIKKDWCRGYADLFNVDFKHNKLNHSITFF